MNFMNVYLFWILFLALWAIVPLMIIKGRTDEAPKIKTSPEIKPTTAELDLDREQNLGMSDLKKP